MKLSRIAVALMLVALSGSAYAQVRSWDFEGMTDLTGLIDEGWVFVDDAYVSVGGTPTQYLDSIQIETSIVHSGTKALRMKVADMAYFPLNGQFGTLELWAYDAGYYMRDPGTGTVWIATAYGPRFGLRKFMDVDTSVWYPDNEPEDHGILNRSYGIGAGLVEKSYLNSNGGYGFEDGRTEHQDIITIASPDWAYTSPIANAGWAGNQSWYSAYYLGIPGGRPTTGVWNKWTIAYTAPGQVQITLTTWDGRVIAAGGVTPGNAFTGTTPGGVSDIYLYGGATMIAGAAPEMWFGDGIYDDITWTPTFVEPICNPGDADGDGDVDLDDFVILKNNFGQTGLDTQTSCSLGDFDLDGDIDLDDFVLLKNNFGNTY